MEARVGARWAPLSGPTIKSSSRKMSRCPGSCPQLGSTLAFAITDRGWNPARLGTVPSSSTVNSFEREIHTHRHTYPQAVTEAHSHQGAQAKAEPKKSEDSGVRDHMRNFSHKGQGPIPGAGGVKKDKKHQDTNSHTRGRERERKQQCERENSSVCVRERTGRDGEDMLEQGRRPGDTLHARVQVREDKRHDLPGEGRLR